MMINLLAAHGLRFKPQAKGTRLWAGVGVILLGIVATVLVVLGGDDKDGVQDMPLIEWSTLWQVFKWSLAAFTVWLAYMLVRLEPTRKIEHTVMGIACLLLGAWSSGSFPRARMPLLSESSLRILWQMLKGGLAGVVLLAGCDHGLQEAGRRGAAARRHRPDARATSWSSTRCTKKGRCTSRKGETVNYVQDIRKVELAVVDPSQPDTDDVTVVPQSLLLAGEHDRARESCRSISSWIGSIRTPIIPNGRTEDDNPATAGTGLEKKAVEVRPGRGPIPTARSTYSSAYVSLSRKDERRRSSALTW